MQPKTLQFQKDTEIKAINTAFRGATIKALLENAAQTLAAACKTSAENLSEQLALQIEVSQQCIVENGVAIIPLQLRNTAFDAQTLLVRLTKPLSLDGQDQNKFDLACFVISPQKDGPLHLRRLSRLVRIFQQIDLIEKIRDTDDAETIRALIHNPEGWMLAA
ncbi:MAG: PTS sugar transporter subunit IIA [Alphaproteobacteria bacterium]